MNRKSLLCVCAAMLISTLFSCGNSPKNMEKENGTVIISGDLSYDKVKNALAPLMGANQKNSSTPKEEDAVYENENNWQTLQIDNQFKGVRGVALTQIEFTQSNKLSVRYFIPDDLKSSLEVTYSDGIVATVSKGNNTYNANSHYVIVKISAPILEYVKLDGVSSLSAGKLQQEKKIKMDISGVSNISFDEIENKEQVTIDISGVSKLQVGSMKNLHLEGNVMGASKININQMETKTVQLNISGTSNVQLDGTFQKIQSEVSGSSSLKLAGNADKATIGVSGVSSLDIKKFNCTNLNTDIGSACNLKK